MSLVITHKLKKSEPFPDEEFIEECLMAEVKQTA